MQDAQKRMHRINIGSPYIPEKYSRVRFFGSYDNGKIAELPDFISKKMLLNKYLKNLGDDF
jgi:hypothetical protein